ncbi:hypothetical protein [Blastococcus xanthinilyticus]|uniref:Uncharacterized protein n=1 Tax=Blastococcus xanthinilyticus TaxID=1564164 RepID=A0A5S5D324_9ACTN|nr:hypothetical protein [Blastococcus xanthinilyticus]TYP89566.1 hypothetical protein BD833_10239 [Blastococcus xanthinilyticus]
MQLGGLRVEPDVSVGTWIAEAVARSHWSTVGSLVPPGYLAYARVLHPAYRYDGDDDVEVPWADVAALNGAAGHPRMQWPAITGGWEYLSEDSQPPTWDGAPAEGHLPCTVAERMTAVLARHTATPDSCLFGRWAGFAFDTPDVRGAPRLELPRARDVLLVRGQVDHAVRNLAPEPSEQSANLWWPADRAWCVATDIDLMSTYVGGTEACIAELLATPGLEVVRADPADRVGHGDDPVNPVPPRG